MPQLHLEVELWVEEVDMQFVCLWRLTAFSWAFASCPSSLSTTGMNDPSIRYDKGFKVAGHLKHIGATPRPPAGIVVKNRKTAWQPNGHCPSHVFFEAQTHPIISVCPIKECLNGEF